MFLATCSVALVISEDTSTYSKKNEIANYSVNIQFARENSEKIIYELSSVKLQAFIQLNENFLLEKSIGTSQIHGISKNGNARSRF